MLIDHKKEHCLLHKKILRFIFSSIQEMVDPKLVIETGVASGDSALAIMESCPNAIYHGYDIWEGFDAVHEKAARARLEKFGERANIHKENTFKLTKLPKNIDIAYVDGDHSTPGCLNDLKLVEKFLSPKGVIVVHDMDFNPVKNAVEQWLDKDKWETIHLKMGCEYIICWRK